MQREKSRLNMAQLTKRREEAGKAREEPLCKGGCLDQDSKGQNGEVL